MTTIDTGNDTRTDVAAGTLEPPPLPSDPEPSEPDEPTLPVPAAPTARVDASPEPPAEPSRPGKARIFAVMFALLITVVLAAVDLGLVATALPTITGELQGLGQISWVITAYLLGATVVLPIYAGLGNRFGHKGMFVLAALVFLAGSFLSGWADTMTQLIAYRAVQGVGAGGLLIGAQAVISNLVPPAERGRYIGIIGAVFGLSTLGGPLLGGYLVEYHSWRWCFYVNLPLVALALIIAFLAIKLPKRDTKPRTDVLGMLFLAGVSICAVFVATWAGTLYAWDDPIILGLAGGGVVLLLAFLLTERLASQPIIPLRLFRDSVFTVGGLIGLVIGFAMVGAITYLPLFLQVVRSATPLESGMLLLPVVTGIFLASVLAGRIAAATGRYKIFPILGTLIAAAGMYLLSRLSETTSDLYNGIAMGVLGVGIGLVVPVLLLAVQNSARPGDAGVATATANYLRQIGGAVGAATFGALLLHRVPAALDEHLSGSLAAEAPDIEILSPDVLQALPDTIRTAFAAVFTDGLPPVFWYGLPVLAAGFVLALFLRRVPLASDADDATRTEEEPEPMSTETPATRNGFIYIDAPATDTGSDEAAPLPDDSEDDADMDTGADDQIRVFVQQEDGAPIKGAVLTLIDTAGNQAGRSMAAGGGVYHVPTPPAGSYVLIARADFHNPRAVPVQVSEGPIDVEIVLGGESGLGGGVYAPDGSTVDAATVTLSDSQGSVAATRSTDSDGEYEFADLLPGSYTLAVNAPSLQPTALSIRVPESGRIRQDVRLLGGSEIYGTAWTRRDRRPIPEARVTVLDSSGHVLAVTTTDSRGHYEFANMTDGDYTVVASCYPPSATPVTISDGQAIEHDVVLGYTDEGAGSPAE